MSHTMKIWEKITDGWIKDKTSIGAEQFGFRLGRSNNGCSFFPQESSWRNTEKDRKEFTYSVHRPRGRNMDWVPQQEVWRCMREKGVPEKYVKIIQDMYDRVQTHVWCSVGETEKFPVKVGLHQGSALIPLPF